MKPKPLKAREHTKVYNIGIETIEKVIQKLKDDLNVDHVSFTYNDDESGNIKMYNVKKGEYELISMLSFENKEDAVRILKAIYCLKRKITLDDTTFLAHSIKNKDYNTKSYNTKSKRWGKEHGWEEE